MLITFTDLGRAVTVDGNQRGRMTIQELGLNRDDLEEKRRRHLQRLRGLERLKQLAELAQSEDNLAFAKRELERCTRADAEYAGLSRWFLRNCVR
jgi:transcription initiation factor TFIIIB Brf1 subunit/transcription initiation factor TFIIB